MNWKKSNPGKSQRSASKALGIPRSTLQYQEKKQASLSGGSEIPIFWQKAEGQAFIKRLLADTIYTFGIKGGIGASRIEEFYGSVEPGAICGGIGKQYISDDQRNRSEDIVVSVAGGKRFERNLCGAIKGVKSSFGFG